MKYDYWLFFFRKLISENQQIDLVTVFDNSVQQQCYPNTRYYSIVYLIFNNNLSCCIWIYSENKYLLKYV